MIIIYEWPKIDATYLMSFARGLLAHKIRIFLLSLEKHRLHLVQIKQIITWLINSITKNESKRFVQR